MQSLGESAPRVVVLGTGGTIAGTARRPGDHVGYVAGQLGVEQLVAAVPALGGVALECEQVAQLDSKDMDHATWQRLAQRAAHHLARADVCGVVVTHGTDTMEETAYFLQRVLAPAKPVVLTGAMRPATALQADGPQNLLDAVAVAREPGARGVVVVMAGAVHSAFDVRKTHTYRLDTFGSGDVGPIGYVEQGRLRRLRDWPQGTPLGLTAIARDPAAWPRVEVVTSHAGADGRIVDVLAAAGVHGVVVAGTGNGTLHHALEAALRRAQAAGVRVRRTTRCASGVLLGDAADRLPRAQAATAVQVRVEVMLDILIGHG
jgi:L-asparaginase